jgi:hypothetical protein
MQTEEDREGGRRKTLRQRFEARTIKPRVKNVDAACWRYSGSHVRGIGSVRITPGVVWRADAVAFSLAHGPWVPSMQLLHSCGARWCINPRHLLVARGPRRAPRTHRTYSPEKKRELLRFVAALGAEEVARTMHVPLGTLERWERALRRDALNGHAHEGEAAQ